MPFVFQNDVPDLSEMAEGFPGNGQVVDPAYLIRPGLNKSTLKKTSPLRMTRNARMRGQIQMLKPHPPKFRCAEKGMGCAQLSAVNAVRLR